jgi:hypothetical protein
MPGTPEQALMAWADETLRAAGCEGCHQAVGWSMVSFDHTSTRFPLEGAHLAAACRSCHGEAGGGQLVAERSHDPTIADPVRSAESPVRFFELATECRSCHADVHVGQFADSSDAPVERDFVSEAVIAGGARGGFDSSVTRCERCHTTQDWRARGFDHQRDARFALDGAHTRVPCASCHRSVTVNEREVVLYRPLDSRCAGCHGPSSPGLPKASRGKSAAGLRSSKEGTQC